MINKLRIFKNKKIVITGHNGFKGSWLSIWLSTLGAKVYGISLKKKEKNYHFDLIKKHIKFKEYFIDIRNQKKLKKKINEIKPDFLFHLAAQSLVSQSVKYPLINWETNVIGFLNVLESLRQLKKKCVIVMITSDKCYLNYEKKRGYSENDRLGGIDPYSASKASAEIMFHSFFNTYIKHKKTNLRIATARAGNVVGGGDWSRDRLIPDCMKRWLKGEFVKIRNPNSTRPWQHVLEAIFGYMILAYHLKKDAGINGQSFNFSSNKIKNMTVINFIKKINKLWKSAKWKVYRSKYFHESNLLQLNNSKAKKYLNWSAILKTDDTINLIVSWYRNYKKNKNRIIEESINQIKYFEKKIKQKYK